MVDPRFRVNPRRFASPFAGQRAKLEPIHQPLYSSFLFAAAQTGGEALLFQYAVGGTVAGTVTGVTATLLHTNIPAAGFLPTPKIYLVTGIRIVPAELTDTLIDPIDDTAATSLPAVTFINEDSNLLEDLTRLVYGSFVRFFVGTKDYLVCPTWITPANTGMMGVSDSWGQMGATPVNNAMQQSFQTFHSMGKYFAMERYPVLIPSQQNFFLSLNFPQATRPTLAATHAVYGVLDGILGRETQ